MQNYGHKLSNAMVSNPCSPGSHSVHFRKEKIHQFVKLEIGALLEDINCPIILVIQMGTSFKGLQDCKG